VKRKKEVGCRSRRERRRWVVEGTRRLRETEMDRVLVKLRIRRETEMYKES
jgi:hypothetical protein